jgi:uncharacterized protein
MRDTYPDVLRGFALLGIAVVNIPLLAIDPVLNNEGADLNAFSNASTAFVVAALFQAKFYLLFSFLFGYSAHYVIKDSKENRGRWVGRSIGLILLGFFHFSLLFFGDILFLYGALGLLLLAFYFRNGKDLKVWAWIIYGVSSLLSIGTAALALVGEQFLGAQGKTLSDLAGGDFSGVMTTTSFFEAIGLRLDLWLFAAPAGLALQGPPVFVAFLVGVLAARRNALGSGVNPALMKKLAFWGLLVGLPLQLFSAYLYVSNATAETYSLGASFMSLSINFITAPILSAGYVGLLWLVSQKFKLSLLSSAGRYSLTIYLSQSLIFAILFSGWGFGLYAQLDVLPVALIAATTWFLLAVLAYVAAKAGRKGPMETVLTGFSKLFVRTR